MGDLVVGIKFKDENVVDLILPEEHDVNASCCKNKDDNESKSKSRESCIKLNDS